MWIIAGTIPDPDFSLLVPEGPAPRSASLSEAGLHLPDGRTVPVERGTAALAATALQTCAALGCTPPALLLAGDTGSGSGSRQLYAWLEKALPALAPRGLTFHYLFPDVDWHNRLLLAVRELENAPLMVADAGFMYVAKMSGYADAYELFTPDVGELAFLADEKAPHPFYTRGFLLAEEQNIPVLLARAQEHGNCPANLIIKGKADHIIHEGRLHAVVDNPSVPAMECIGGTGDIVTGLVTGLLCAGLPTATAALAAARLARLLAAHCRPDPSTPVSRLIAALPEVLPRSRDEILALGRAGARFAAGFLKAWNDILVLLWVPVFSIKKAPPASCARAELFDGWFAMMTGCRSSPLRERPSSRAAPVEARIRVVPPGGMPRNTAGCPAAGSRWPWPRKRPGWRGARTSRWPWYCTIRCRAAGPHWHWRQASGKRSGRP